MKKGHIFFVVATFALLLSAGQAQAVTFTGKAAVVTPIATVNATTTTTVSTTTTAVDTSGIIGTGTVTVNAAADLQSVAGTIQSSNSSVASVDVSNDTQVSVTYHRPAKLFGFIETTITEKATVSTDASGKAMISVEKPWWSFLATSDTNSAAFTDALQTRLNASAATMDTVGADGKLSVSGKAYLLTQIEAAAEATYSVNATY